MPRPALFLIPALAMLSGCSAAEDPYTPREGLWEITVDLVSINDPLLSPADVATLRRVFAARNATKRECNNSGAQRVGQPVMGGRCQVSAAADAGATVNHQWRCPAADGAPPQIIRFSGTRAAERYDYRITVDAGNGRGRVVTRERGRRIGDCPPGGAPPQP